ncbi:uncharacterized protein LOC144531875 isoform X1 [Sander vitreus]
MCTATEKVSFPCKTWSFFQKLSPTKLGPYNQTTRHKSPHSSPVFPPPSSTMTTSLPPPESRGIDHSLLTCGETKCSGHGACKVPLGGSIGFVCDCDLGYRGQFCENTVNGALSVTLTLSVLALIIGGLIVAFILAKMKQKHKKRKREQLAKMVRQ